MSKQDNDLEKLFKTAKVVRPDVQEVEAGLESRISARLREENGKEALLSVWTWRLAPIMAIPLLILIMISAFLEFQNSRDLFSPIDAYERAQINRYLTGE
jgi:hypothetical protein